MRRIISLAIIACAALLAGGALLRSQDANDGPKFQTIELKKMEVPDLQEQFASYYKPVEVAGEAKIAAYDLPLDLGKIANYAAVSQKLGLKKGEDLLKKNGFVVIPWGRAEKINAPYEELKKMEVPVFVTSDTLLHLYHIQFDETLKDIEEREFFPDLVAMTKAMYEASLKEYEAEELSNRYKKALMDVLDVMEAWKRNAIFFAVALSILEERQEITPESLTKMTDEDFTKFMEKMRNASNDPAFSTAWSRLMYGRQRDVESAKVVLKYYKEPAVETTKFPEWVEKIVKEERALIAAHEGFGVSPLFNYKEDYSQYVPRGHYTRTFVLQKYFKAMMWYGRLTFIIKGKIIQKQSEEEKEREAKIQTLQAALISAIADKVTAGKRTVAEIWQRIYGVTAFYVGFADDLTPYEYRETMLKVFGGKFEAVDILKEPKWFEFRKALALLRSPEIYGGTGDIAGPPVEIANEEDLKKALEDTKGMRLMGQRFIPDSYVMGRLVYPTVGQYKGRGTPFTLVVADGGPIRGFPRGLDVMALLGSKRAREIIEIEGDADYEKYDETMKKLAGEFAKFDAKQWNRNLYWSWLYALKALVEPAGKGTQAFMQTEAWTDKQLNASLASWAELRHDTILYAKQSYTMGTTSMPQEPKPVVGYVEPVPEFYARLLALTRMTKTGLGKMNVLDEKAGKRLEMVESLLQKLLDIAIKELEDKPLTEAEYEFIRNFGESLEGAITGVSEAGEKTTMVADVHTDTNSKQCLEEGVGCVQMLVAAYRLPDGRILIGAGPVLSYYEFKQPMGDRLTDEKWRQMLESGKAPARPKWTGSFSGE